MPYHLLFEDTECFKDYFFDSNKESIKNLPNTNKINIFIGANNSGKSRFVRNLIKGEKFRICNLELYNEYNSFLNKKMRILHNPWVKNVYELPLNFSIDDVLKHNFEELSLGNLSDSNDLKRSLKNISVGLVQSKDNKAYYIPALRTAHSLFEDGSKKIESDIYIETLKKTYQLTKANLAVFTGLHLHKEILNARNSKKEIRKRFEDFEKFLSKNFFDGKAVDVVAEFNKDDSLKGSNSGEIISVHVEGDQDRYLYDLGDGIQAIIILMYQIFMAEPNSFIYIDEPELHLHPGMQRLFLEQLCSNPDLKDKKLTYFITTHSNHLLDLTIEKDNVSIYSFTQRVNDGQKQFVIKNVNAGDNEILKNLGVNNSSVFMANCSIWVEGISDRNYIKAFLKAYSDHLFKSDKNKYKSLKEDIDFAFFEYAGSNIDHYFFGDLQDEQEDEIIKGIKALALHNKIFLLADSDCAPEKSAKDDRLQKLKDAQKPNFTPYIIEDVREVENLLTNEIWEKVLIEFCNKNLSKNPENNIEDKISKAFAEPDAISYQDFQEEYIGNYLNIINNRLGDIGGTNVLNKIFEIKSEGNCGTFIYKRELSESVLKKVYDGQITWEHFSKNPKIVTLTEEIYNFIVSSKH